VEPFAKHFARRTRHAFATLPANVNPYLWQMYRGCYPPNVPAPWFSAAAPDTWPEISWSNTVMTEALAQVREPVDFVHLSNILDWLSPEEAGATLGLAAAALKPGGYVLIRQLNSTLDIPGLGPAFDWQRDQARELHAADRSFFYRDLHLGRKR
jgi:S-adenosylmethionine-diacylglycerol 3-amino-3-carboxypropyl transferase